MEKSQTQDKTFSSGGNIHSSANPPSRLRARRKILWVKKSLQSRYILYYTAIMLFSGFALFALINRYAHQALSLEMQQAHSAVYNTWSILKTPIVHASLIVVLIVVVIASVTTLFLALTVHRASRALASNVRAFMKGSPLGLGKRIRHPVEFQHLQEGLTAALSSHQERIKHLHRDIAALKGYTRRLRENADRGVLTDQGIGALRSAFEEMKQHVGERGRKVLQGGRNNRNALRSHSPLRGFLADRRELLRIAMALIAVFVLRGAVHSDEELPEPHYTLNNETPCLDCHDTYRDEVDEHEFVLGVTEICKDCHDIRQLWRSHPYDVDVAKSEMEDLEIPDELPLADGYMTCGSCHNPHAEYLVTFKIYDAQDAIVDTYENYYQTWFTRIIEPGRGWDPLCLGCHPNH